MNNRLLFSLCLAIILGLTIAYVDTRPHWNDTGVSMFMILASGLLCGYLSPSRPWLRALAVGLWTPVFNIVLAANYGSLLALVPAFIGVFAGRLLRLVFIRENHK